MNTHRSTPRAALAALLTLLVVGTGLVPGFADRGDVLRTTIESPHDAADCPGAHDHRVCAQINGSPRAAGAVGAASLPLEGTTWTMAVRLDASSTSGAPAHHPARAPPA